MTKTVLIVGAGIEQTIAIKEAKKLGYKVVACDGNIDAKGKKYADDFICCDIKNVELLIEIGNKYKVDGIFCHAIEIPIQVAKAAESLGLFGIEVDVAKNCTYKLRRLEILSKAGVNVPKFSKIFCIEDALAFLEKYGKIVLKPIDNAGARGITIVDNKKLIKKAFNEAMKFTKYDYVIAEEYIKPKCEISSETLINKGNMYHFGFADRNYEPYFYPYPVENGHSVPSMISEPLKYKVLQELEKAIKALGFTKCIAKGDILINENEKVYIIEIAARTSGGWFSAGTVPAATGVNIIKVLLKLSVGEDFQEHWIKPTKNKVAVQRYLMPRFDVYIKDIEGLTEARQSYGIVKMDMFLPKKDTCVHKAINNAERWGHLIAVGDTYEEALLYLGEAKDKIVINAVALPKKEKRK